MEHYRFVVQFFVSVCFSDSLCFLVIGSFVLLLLDRREVEQSAPEPGTFVIRCSSLPGLLVVVFRFTCWLLIKLFGLLFVRWLLGHFAVDYTLKDGQACHSLIVNAGEKGCSFGFCFWFFISVLCCGFALVCFCVWWFVLFRLSIWNGFGRHNWVTFRMVCFRNQTTNNTNPKTQQRRDKIECNFLSGPRNARRLQWIQGKSTNKQNFITI